MNYFSLKKAISPSEEKDKSEVSLDHSLKNLKKILGHPVRIRIIGMLSIEKAMTQRELGKAVFMSNAAMHYHLKTLEQAGLVRLKGTRPGPNGITEKLFMCDKKNLQRILSMTEAGVDMEFYMNYILSWAQERHREGLELLKSKNFSDPFLAGSYSVNAPKKEIADLQRKIRSLYDDFFEKFKNQARKKETLPVALTYALLPTTSAGGEDSRQILEYEVPESKKSDA